MTTKSFIIFLTIIAIGAAFILAPTTGALANDISEGMAQVKAGNVR